MRPIARLAALAAFCVLTAACAPEAKTREKILWAWERPEDLSFLEPEETKVAVLAATVTLDGVRVEVYGRRQPLKLPAGLVPIPVVRIETRHPALDNDQRQKLVAILVRYAESRSVPALQIDFDAKASERKFYRALLDDLAQHLAPDDHLSITALASWCLDDRWLENAPIAEAVPMLFDMGKEADAIRARLGRGEDFAEPLCRQSYGLALDEPWPKLASGRRIYLFSDRPWSREDFAGMPGEKRR